MFRAIVVGTDGSETAQKAVDAAVELAALSGATLQVVCAYEPVADRQPRRAVPQVVPDREWTINRRADVDATLQHAAGRAREGGVAARTSAREGDPADAILDVAEEAGADLIVVGNKGTTGARRFLLGSVPNRVSHHAPCAVMIIRTT